MEIAKFVCVGALCLVGMTIAGCQPPPAHSPSLSEVIFDPKASTGEKEAYFRARLGDPVWQKRWWIEKTARILRGGEGIGPHDDMTALLKMSEDDIAKKFMADPRFGDSVLDFNLYFLGFKPDSLKMNGQYTATAFDYPSAVVSTQEVLRNGDYLKIFDLEGPYFPPPLEADTDLVSEDDGFSREEVALGDYTKLRAKMVADFLKKLEKLHSNATKRGASGSKICKEIETNWGDLTEDVDRFEIAFGKARSLQIQARLHPTEFGGMEFIEIASAECDQGSPNLSTIVKALEKSIDQFTRSYAELNKFEPGQYQPKSVAEFKPYNFSGLSNQKFLALSAEQALSLTNSSTNLNRRRSAYVLKRYFCDDLTPVGFEDPKTPVGGEHGSETSCYACHFKLDPMAGFFRNYGYAFNDFSSQSYIQFDDDVEVDRLKYQEAWKDKTGKRTWDVGYIRSTTKESLNSYGENLADLSKIIRASPEARKCVMKRLFEYVIAEKQTIDGGYLDHLTQEFDKEAAVNSSLAIKNAMIRLLKSQSFHQEDADPNQCYDFAPGVVPGATPPCRVAFILQKNCVSCHNNANDGRAGLDFSKWIMGPDGKNYNFPHLDLGTQVEAKETLASIANRLTTNDSKLRMPAGRSMADQERQELYLWTQDELARIQKGSP